MLVDLDGARAILAGKRTQLLRRARPHEHHCPLAPGDRLSVDRWLTDAEVREAGVDVLLAVQEGRMTRPATHVAFVVVRDARRVKVGCLHFADLFRLGYSSTAAFQADQVRAYDGLWRHRLRRQGIDPDDPELVAQRFQERHANANAWLVRFDLDPEGSRFLAARSELGYVPAVYDRRGRRVALEDEPEAVDAATQERISTLGREADARRRDERLAELAELPLVERVRRLEAARTAVDLSSDLRVIASRALRALRRAAAS